MTSEIRANTLKNRVGLGTVEYANTGIVVSGIVTANSFSGPLTATSIDLNGDLDVDGHTNLDNVSIAGVTTFSSNTIVTDGSSYSITQGSSGVFAIAASEPRIRLIDNESNPNYSIYNTSGVFRIHDETSNVNRLTISSSGNVSITNDLDVDGHTNLDNVNVAGVSTFSGNIQLLDNVELNLGTHNDFDIFHNDDDAYIRNAKGALIIRNNGQSGDADASQIYIQATPAENSIQCSPNGAVFLYHDNQIRLSTTAAGVSIIRDLDVDGHTNLDNVNIVGVTTTNGDVRIGSGDLRFENNAHKIYTASSSYTLTIQGGGSNPGGKIELRGGTSDNDIRFLTSDGSGNSVEKVRILSDGNTEFFNGSNSSTIKLKRHASTASQQAHIGYFSSGLHIETREATYISLKTNTQERLRITSGGDVGINVTPISGVTLQVGTPNTSTGVMRGHPDYFSIDSGSSAGGGVVGTASNPALIFGGDGNTGLYHSASDTLNFTTGGTERLRITSGGTVQINAGGNLYVVGGGSYNASLNGNILSFDRAGYSYIDQTSNSGTLVFRVGSSSANMLRLDITNAYLPNGTLVLGTQNTSSGHINAYENMSFNIDTDNDDTNRYFSFHANGNSASGTELLRITESGNTRIGVPPTNGSSTLISEKQATIGTKHFYTVYHNFSSTNSPLAVNSKIPHPACGTVEVVAGWSNGNGLRLSKFHWTSSGSTSGCVQIFTTTANRYGVSVSIGTPTMSISGDYTNFSFTFSDTQGSKMEKLKIHFEYFNQFRIDG